MKLYHIPLRYFALLILLLVSTHVLSKEWQAVGPKGGTFTFTKINPIKSINIYAFSKYGALAWSHNKGQSWELIQAGEKILVGDTADTTAVESSLISIGYTSNTLLHTQQRYNDLGVPEASIVRSLDSGKSWTNRVELPIIPHESSPPERISILAVDPNNRLNIYAIAGNPTTVSYIDGMSSSPYWRRGLVKSNDGGLTWSSFPFAFMTEHPVLSIASDSTLYVGANLGLYKSKNAGKSWQYIYQLGSFSCDLLALEKLCPTSETNPIERCDAATPIAQTSCSTASVSQLQISPVDPDIIYIRTGISGRYLRSDNGGINWTAIVDRHSFRSLVPDPIDKNIVYAIGSKDSPTIEGTYYPIIARSHDRGITWQIIDINFKNYLQLTDLTIDPSDNKLIYLNLDGKIFTSRDGLKSIEPPAKVGRPMSGFLSFGQTDKVKYLKGEDGFYKFNPKDSRWEKQSLHCLSPNASDSFYFKALFQVNPIDENKILCVHDDFSPITYSDDAGKNWQSSSFNYSSNNPLALGVDNTYIHHLALAIDGKTGYAWNSYNILLTTEDGGHSWHDSFNPLMRDHWQALITHPTVAKEAILVGEKKVYKTTDGGKSWKTIIEQAESLPYIHKLEYDTLQPQTLYALTSIGFFRSDNGGVQWQSLDFKLPKAVQTLRSTTYISWTWDLLVSHKYPDTLYLSFRAEDLYHYVPMDKSRIILSQVYVSHDKGRSWRALGKRVLSNKLSLSPESETLFVSGSNGVFELKD